jgi:hypothetical protein
MAFCLKALNNAKAVQYKLKKRPSVNIQHFRSATWGLYPAGDAWGGGGGYLIALF